MELTNSSGRPGMADFFGQVIKRDANKIIMKFIFATDIHGSYRSYRRLFSIALRRNIETIIIGGDFAPKKFAFIFRNGVFATQFTTINGWLKHKVNFVEEGYFPIKLGRYVKESDVLNVIEPFRNDFRLLQLEATRNLFSKLIGKFAGKFDIFMMPGNDDVKETTAMIESVKSLHQIHGKCVQVDDVTIAGYSYVPPTPFRLKDWEKPEESILKDLDRLAKDFGDEVILSIHAPPYGTGLDIIKENEHIGSKSVRKFIEKEQPFLTLHGHIHESSGISNLVMSKIGSTFAFNPGDSEYKLKALVIDSENANHYTCVS